MFRSIRFKSTILYSSILCVILVLFSGALFFIVRDILYRDIDEELRIKANEIANIFKIYNKVESAPANRFSMIDKFFTNSGIGVRDRMIIDDLWRMESQTLNLKDDYINVLNSGGVPVIISKNMNKKMRALFHEQVPFSFEETFMKTVNGKALHLRTISLPVLYQSRYRIVIQVATPLDSDLTILDRLKFFIFLTILLTLVLTSFLGNFFAGRILKPVMRVIKTADDISYEDLHMRIESGQADDEIKKLINSLNGMISRLESSFQHISEFSLHVAHELKTPLAIMRGEMELTLNETRDAEEYKRVLTVVLEETNRLIRIIKDLLLLSKLDYQPDIFQFERLEFTGFIRDIYQDISILASEKRIKTFLDIRSEEAFIAADKIHLRRLFFNLINNAVKFTPMDGEIRISAGVTGAFVQVSISDTGPGISKENLKKIFDKFFRVYSGEDDSIAGNGLGLSIAQSIARAHKGVIEVQSVQGKGTVFTVTLPLA